MVRRICDAALLLVLAAVIGCTTGVEPSPSPGIIRVRLKANELDTSIIIQNDTSRFSRWDNFNLFVSAGRLYRGENYALIYAERSTQRIPGDTVNIIAREWLDGRPITTADTDPITPANSRYRRYVVFDSYVPPGEYDRLSFGLNAHDMQIFVPKNYQNPVELPPGAPSYVEFRRTFTVQEGRVTEIDVEIKPFQSLSRYRDSFLFDRKVEIVRVELL